MSSFTDFAKKYQKGKTAETKVSFTDYAAQYQKDKLAKEREKRRKNAEIQRNQNIIDLGYGPISNKTLDSKILSGEVVRSNVNGTPQYFNYKDIVNFANKTANATVQGTANVMDAGTNAAKEDKEEERTWFKGSEYFEDGCQLGDFTKAYSATTTHLFKSAVGGILDWGEAAWDALVNVATVASTPTPEQHFMENGGAFSNYGERGQKMAEDLYKKEKEAVTEAREQLPDYVAQDLYDGQEVANKIIVKPYEDIVGIDVLGGSLLGKKSEDLAASGGQMLATAGLNAIGVPWFLTTGITSYGSQVEEAYKEGATIEEATFSATVSAITEVGVELLSGGIKFKLPGQETAKTLDDILLKPFLEKVTNKAVRKFFEFGIDALGEGGEEVLSGFISNFGSSIYKLDEETLGQILFSEEACDEYLESFIGGMVLGGSSSAVKIVVGGKSVEITEVEKKVYEAVSEERIAEATKDGKELTEAEETEIRKGVLSEIDNGTLDTEKIEKVLGGEDFEAYKKTKDEWLQHKSDLEAERDKYQQEYDKLYDMPYAEKNDRYQARQDEVYNILDRLNSELKTLQENASVSELGAKLYGKIDPMIKGTRLEESYNRYKDFEADYSKYEGAKYESAVKQTLDNAVNFTDEEGGKFKNSRNVRNFIDFHANISAKTGLVFRYITNAQAKNEFIERQTKEIAELEKIPEAQRTEEQNKLLAEMKDTLEDVKSGKLIVNGDNDLSNGVITINLDSKKALNRTTGHEVVHAFEKAKGYDVLKKIVFEYAKARGVDIDAEVKARERKYQGVKNANAEAELVADLIGDYLFTDTKFIQNLSVKHRNIFQKLWDEIKYLCKIATAGSDEARQLEQLKHQFEKVWREGGKSTDTDIKAKDGADTNVQNSLSTEQESYFADSKVRDENGNLKVMYHGTSKGGFTSFDTYGSQYGLFGTGSYFTDNKSIAESYTNKGKGDNKQVYETYLNITNPLDMDAEADVSAWSKAFPDADFTNCTTNEDCYRAMEEYFEDEQYSKWEASEIAVDAIRGMGYDGITHIGGGRVNAEGTKHQVYIAFEPEQIKNIDNIAPTKDADIRYSLSENSEGEALTNEQAEYFKDAKTRDTDGSLMVLYHGSPNGSTTIFDKSKTSEINDMGQGIYFSSDSDDASSYMGKSKNKKLYRAYVNITKPFVVSNDVKITIEDAVKLLKFCDDKAAAIDVCEELLINEKDGYVTTSQLANSNISIHMTKMLEKSKLYDGIIDETVSEKFGLEKGIKHIVALNSNQIKLTDNKAPTVNPDIRYSFSSVANTFFDDPGMSAKDFIKLDYHETQGYKDYVEKCVNNYRQTRTDFDESAARKSIEDSIDGIVRVAIAAKNAGYDIRDNNREKNTRDSKNRLLFSSLEPNSDYFTSNDISTECDKRKNFAETYDAIVKKEEAMGVPKGKRFFDNIDNYFYIHKVLADKGLTQPCRQCYVESMRKNLAPMARKFLQLVNETDVNNKANDQLYQTSGKNKGQLKSNNAKLRERVLEILGSEGKSIDILTIDALTTAEGLATLRLENPYIYEAFNSFYGQSKPKMPKSATPFRFGELTALLTDSNGKINQKLVNRINATGGFRLQSYSDFQIQNYVDTLQVLFEAGTLGLSGHAYTKVPAFLEATEGTNLKRNISIFMYKDGNEWKIDKNDSFPYELNEIYDIVNNDATGNTSIIAVSQNDDMSAWIMANDYVGYGIPFHKSGLKMGTVRDTDVKTDDGRIIKGYSGIKDHTKQQTEVWAKTTADHKALTKVKKGINIYSKEVGWDFENKKNLPKNELIEKNVRAYIDACERAGYLPKFRAYVMNNGTILNKTLQYGKELGFLPQNATIEDISFEYKGYTIPYGYYKFLGDFGMFTPNGQASAPKTLSLDNYDFDKAVDFFADSEKLRRNEILQQFANGEERAKYRDSDLTAGELEDIVRQKRSEVVDEIVAPSKFSLSEDGEQENFTAPSDNDIYGKDILYQSNDIAPVGTVAEDTTVMEDIAPMPQTVSKTETVEDIAPIGNQYEAIKPRPEALEGEEAQWAANKMARADKGNTVQPSAYQQTGEAIPGESLLSTGKSTKGKGKTWSTLVRNFVSKGAVFEKLSLKTGNRAVEDKYKMWKDRSESMAQYFMEKGKGDVPSLKSVYERASKAGLDKEFDLYMKHRNHVDRMKYNKGIFGNLPPAISTQTVERLQKQHPEFKGWAEDVYKINNHLKGMLVENGFITQKTADLWAKQYPNYIPIERLVGDGDVAQQGGDGIGISAPLKKAVGGNQEVETLYKTMAHRIEQVYKAVNKNAFGVELKNTLQTVSEVSDVLMEAGFDGLSTLDDSLLTAGTSETNPTFTVFENGKRVTFAITDEMYEALKPTSEALSKEHKLLSKPTAWHKKVLTEYNLFFTARNFPKDAQEVIFNSKHAAKTYANMPKAVAELLKGKGKYITEYWENGGKSNTYFDSRKNEFKTDSTFKKVMGFVPDKISKVNDFVEAIPRLAEYMASRKQGATIEAAMTDAARVTTDFSDGGDITKFFNRNGVTFLNASVQGAAQQVRNIRQAKAEGFKGVAKLAAKYALSGLPVLLFNQLIWDDDEEYEELSEYVKDNYYIVAKYGDGQFVRIPKGRTIAVVQELFEQFGNAITGEETDWKNVYEMAVSNLAPNNPIDNNILAPIKQVAEGKTWYGDDLVPSRLQDLPAAEQYDESIDSLSKWLGEKFNVSPYKINYVLNQYSGFVGDIFLPALTPEAERGDDSFLGNFIAPLRDQFVVDSTMKNRNPSDFFSLSDELKVNANSENATDEDKLMYKYINSANYEISDLYKQKREIQNSNLSDELKYNQVRDIQAQINEKSKDALNTYENVKVDGNYATVGDMHFRLNDKGEWQNITDKQLEKQNEAVGILGITPSQYWNNKAEYDYAVENPEKYAFLEKEGIGYRGYQELDEDTKSAWSWAFKNQDKYEYFKENGVLPGDYSTYYIPMLDFKDEGNEAYSWAFENPEKATFSKAITDDVVKYREITSGLYEIRADKDSNGKTINGSTKRKKKAYIWSLDIDDGAKYILYKSEYNSVGDYNDEIIEYLNNRNDLSYDEKKAILEQLGARVDAKGGIYW